MSAMVSYCSFCGKSELEAFCLIAGPTVFICDECVELCRDMVGSNRLKQAAEPAVAESASPNLHGGIA